MLIDITGISFATQLEACRARLYAIDGRDPKTDDVPQPSLEWKKACAQYILPQVNSI